MSQRHVMIDLETLGVGPLASILTIGWCHFDESYVGTPSKIQVDVQSCINRGMIVKDSTFRFWTQQSDEARAMLNDSEPVQLPDALQKFALDFKGDEIVWGNGSNFDISILETAYELCSMELPWKFWNVGCYRTLKRYSNAPKVQPKIPHCAASDAVAQAQHLQNIWKDLGFET